MATDPSQISEDLTAPSPYVPTRAELENRLTQLRSRLPQPNRNPPPSPHAYGRLTRRGLFSLISLFAQFFSRMKAPAGGPISLFSHKVHSFFRKLCGVGKPGQRARAGYRGEGPIGVLQPGAGQRRFFPAHICREVMRRLAPAEQRLVSRRGSLHRQCRD